ncbi:hypothetical protein SPBR_07341 [Sporothrix brasiliensis 5110]|uniref:HNH nuclease domain-containing protein n=1 Tax=Sporothrix brasiliensis 5110 TaxID=1398154 RepID=A0A0C2IXG7_9PEZI|nr:uncharacterized protein SPBR_07341 [Sporothrix brasiliensis 5110]KIH89702.1 hypothetical protein SPBR_07341 [Sporothrix brasiliensis 5110]
MEERLLFAEKWMHVMHQRFGNSKISETTSFTLSVVYALPLREVRRLGETLSGSSRHLWILSLNAEELSNTAPATTSSTARSQAQVSEEPGCTDKAWNMICLTPTLHGYWAKGYFALRCLGVSPVELMQTRREHDDGETPAWVARMVTRSGGKPPVHGKITLQMEWLPVQASRTASHSGGKPNKTSIWNEIVPSEDREHWFRSWERSERYGEATESSDAGEGDEVGGAPVIGATNIRTSRAVETGDCFSVTLPTMEEAFKMKAMIDIQHAYLRMASLSGAAGDPDFLKHSLDDWDEGDGDGTAPIGQQDNAED